MQRGGPSKSDGETSEKPPDKLNIVLETIMTALKKPRNMNLYFAR